MEAKVVDTNVPLVANEKAPQANADCVMSCIDALKRVVQGELVVIDAGMDILTEYMKNLSMSGQPGPGDAFFKWLWQNQANSSRVERVEIHLSNGEYEEFPADPKLAGFDLSDRKFVAVALASASNPEILNASDTDWAISQKPLEENGVRIRFLCPELM